MRFKMELNRLQSALEDVFLYGEISHGDKLDKLLKKHGLDFDEPFGIIDLITEFCRKYNLTASFNKRGKLILKKTKKGGIK